mmetsp:Transcript_2200/g.3144  ORF Transcript_2200/g.3144 Transcript_2200/m.3144 type:complete len:124 (-) Transcript_2200:2902-3273(-)
MVSSDTLKTLLLLGYNIVAIQGSFVTNHQHVVSSGTNLFQVGGTKKADNKAMSFLKKIGRVGGARNVDFTNSMGVDEGPAGKTYYATKVRKYSSLLHDCLHILVCEISNIRNQNPFPFAQNLV